MICTIAASDLMTTEQRSELLRATLPRNRIQKQGEHRVTCNNSNAAQAQKQIIGCTNDRKSDRVTHMVDETTLQQLLVHVLNKDKLKISHLDTNITTPETSSI